MNEPHWLSIHWVRYRRAMSPAELDLRPSAQAEVWRFGLDSAMGSDGLREMWSETWGGIGIFARREDAESVLAAPREHLPFLEGSIEAWHALAVPIAHHGTVNWRGTVENGTAIRAARSDPGGPLAVLTTAAYDQYTAEELPRIIDFLANGDQVLRSFSKHPGNVRSCLFMPFDAFDGLTCTLWKDDASMLDAVYRAGPHREQIVRHGHTPIFDRSCFTRVRLVSSVGTWGGRDPVSEMHHAPPSEESPASSR